MNEQRRLEDNISVDDLMKKPQKELLTMIYIQAVKMNGTIKQNCNDISELQTEMKDKIGWKLFKNFGIVLTVIFTVISIVAVIIDKVIK
jgi:hypothetical protein